MCHRAACFTPVVVLYWRRGLSRNEHQRHTRLQFDREGPLFQFPGWRGWHLVLLFYSRLFEHRRFFGRIVQIAYVTNVRVVYNSLAHFVEVQCLPCFVPQSWPSILFWPFTSSLVTSMTVGRYLSYARRRHSSVPRLVFYFHQLRPRNIFFSCQSDPTSLFCRPFVMSAQRKSTKTLRTSALH